METIDDLVLVGLSQRTAPVAVRERYALQPEDAPGLLRQLVGDGGLDEAVVLSTCNRTEALALGGDGAESIARLKAALFRNIDAGHLYEFRGLRAVMHLFRVTSGLDSLVLGETEILGQIKRAFETARGAGAAGQVLAPLLTQALSVGKRARNETSISEGSLSVARVGLEVASRALGQYDGRTATVIGAGDTGVLATRHLLDAGAARVHLLNRTPERAVEAATELGDRVTPASLDRMDALLDAADIGVVCVDGAADLIGVNTFDRRKLGRRDQPLVLLDLSVPRAVQPDVGELDGVLLYDLDALLPIVEQNRSGRAQAMEDVGTILVSEVHKFLSLRMYANFSPAIEELKDLFDREREGLLDRVTGGQATPRELELAHAMEKKFLWLALEQMKQGARHTRSEEALDRAYRRFIDELEQRH
ncbi:MAG: glutamyl-tRNA reductase [Planctomycetota bacterium]|nr:glutamyl-tRNA reductase [Planctomycetota bacterium]MEC8511497.1 glutamyl-tRNA reductase [Planctomycetota bacterium]